MLSFQRDALSGASLSWSPLSLYFSLIRDAAVAVWYLLTLPSSGHCDELQSNRNCVTHRRHYAAIVMATENDKQQGEHKYIYTS